MTTRRMARILAITASLLTATASVAHGQAGWSATLFVDPFPPSYLSDWELNPTLASLTISNGTGADASVTIHFIVTAGDGRVVLSGRSDPQLIPAGMPVTYNTAATIGGTSEYDTDIEDVIARTGRFPEDDYTACATVVDAGGFVVADNVCADFTTVFPDPPYLLFPLDGDTVPNTDPIFEWTPVQAPVTVQPFYVLQVAEILPGQTPYEALTANILHFENPALTSTAFQYPLGALPLTAGRRYAWWVQALSMDGYPLSANQGRSEVWTFTHLDPDGGDPTGEEVGGSVKARLVHRSAAGTGPLANLGSLAYETVRDEFLNAEEGELRIPLPLPNVDFFDDLPLSNVRVDYNDASEALAVTATASLPVGAVNVLLLGRWDGSGGGSYLLGIEPAAFDLAEWVDGLSGTAFDDVDLNGAILTIADGAETLQSAHLPLAVEQFYGLAEVPVEVGLNLHHVFDLRGTPMGQRLTDAGLTIGAVELGGRIGIDPSAIFGQPTAEEAPSLELAGAFQYLQVQGMPDWLTVQRAGVRLTNDPAPEVAAELAVSVELPDRTLDFVLAADLSGDTAAAPVVLTGTLATPLDELFGVSWLSIDSLTLTVTPPDEAAGTPLDALLGGRMHVGQQPILVTARLEDDGGQLGATFTASADELGISDLLAFAEAQLGSVPFADQIPGDLAALTDVELSFRTGEPPTFTIAATASVLGQSTDVLYTLVPSDFTGTGAPGAVFGFRLADWSLGNVIPALQGNPLGDFRFPAVSFVLGPGGVPAPPDPDDPEDPEGEGGDGWSIPWSGFGGFARDWFASSDPCAASGATGCGGGAPGEDDGSSLNLRPGLNFSAPISFSAISGWFGGMFGDGGGDGESGGSGVVLRGSPGFTLSGLFSGDFDLANLLDIRGRLPLPEGGGFGWPDWLDPGDWEIQVVGNPALRVQLAATMEADLDGPRTFDIATEITNAEGGGAAFEGTMRGSWPQPFGLQWLTLDSVTIGLAAGSVGPRVMLGSAFDVGTVSAAVAIDVKGTSGNRTLDFAASVRNLSTADVVTFANDAFDAGLGAPANPVTLDSLLVAFGTGEASSFDLSGGFSAGMDPLAALVALADIAPGVTAPSEMPFDIGGLAGAWFDLHVIPDSVWGGYGGQVTLGAGTGAEFDGAAAIRLGASRTGGGDWLALDLDLAARNLSATDAVTALSDALPGDWTMPEGVDALSGTTLDSARLRMGLDTRTDSASAAFAGAGRYEQGGATLTGTLRLGLFDVSEATWATGALTILMNDVPVSDALAQAASLLPGDWSLPSDLDALAPVQLDSGALTVGFDSRVDSLSARVGGTGTMGGAGGLAAAADLILVRAYEESWASGRLDLRITALPIPDALAEAATLLPGDWTLPSAVSGLAPIVLDSATLGLVFDTREQMFGATMTGASHLDDGGTRIDGSTSVRLLLIDEERIADGWVRLGVRNLSLTDVLNQTAALLPGDWTLPTGFTAFDALSLDSAALELSFDTRADSVGATASGTGRFGQGAGAFGASAELRFAQVAGASGAGGTMTLARSSLTMTEVITQIAGMLPGEWTLPSGLDAFDAVALDTAQLRLGFDTWTDSVFAGVWGAGQFNNLRADATLDFVQLASGRRVSGLMTIGMGAVGAGEAIAQIAGLLPGSWSLPAGFSSFDALTLDSASLYAGFDTGGDSLFAGFQGGGRLSDVNAEARLGFARVGSASYGSGLVTLTLGDVTLADAFNRVTGLLPGDWGVPEVDFDIGSLRDAGLELGFDTRTDSLWAGVTARATLARRDGVASLDVVSVGSGTAARSWVTGTFRLDVGDLTLPGALTLASELVPGAPQIPTLDFDIGRITDAALEAGFTVGDGDSVWAGVSGGFRLGRFTGRANMGLTLGRSTPQGRFTAAFDNRFAVSDVVQLFTGLLPGGGINVPPLGPLDIAVDNPQLTLDIGERTGVSFTGNTQLFGKTGSALFSLASIGGRPQFILGVQVPDLGFGDIVPAFENPVTDQLRLALAALTVTGAEGEVEDEELSPEERAFFRPLMGGVDDFTVDFVPGLNLTGLIPLANAGAMKDMVDMLTPGASNLTLQGTIPIPGLGGLRDLQLRAALPPMAPPGKPAWFVSGEIAVQITGRPSVGVAGALTVDVDGDTLTFDIESNVAIVPAGGVELSIAGGLTAERGWVGPLGIDWLTINEVRLALGLSPVAVRLGFLGDAVFGSKDIRVGLGTLINIYTGVPMGVIVLGESEAGLSLGDLIWVGQQVAGDAIPADAVPDMAVRDLGLKIATYSDFDLGIEAGFAISGAYYLEMQRNGQMSEVGRIELDIGLQGITGLARLTAFSIGPVHFDEALLDLALTIPDQHLIISGGATIDNAFSANILLAMSRDSLRFETEFDLFNAFRTHLLARAAFSLMNPTFAVRGTLYPQFSDEVTLDLAQAVIPVAQGTMTGAAATLHAAQETLDAAEIALNALLVAAAHGPRLAMEAAYGSYRYAHSRYSSANSRYHYHRRRCSWRRPWHCGQRSYWWSARSYWYTQRSVRWGIYVTARAIYQNREYLQNNPAVDGARAELVAARADVAAAQAEVDRIRAALNDAQRWVDAYDSCTGSCQRPPMPFGVVRAQFDAALNGLFGRSGIDLSLTYQVFGDQRTITAGFGGSVSDLAQSLVSTVSDALFN